MLHSVRFIKILAIFLWIGQSSAMYPASSDVVELTAANFDKLVVQSKSIWVVEFFAPWCGHCQQLVPEYQKAGTALKGVVNVGAVNCDDHNSICGQFGVKGFPTIKIFASNKKSPVDFNGQRTAQGIVDAAMSEANKQVKAALNGGSSGGGGGSSGDSAVIELTDSNFDKLVLQSDDVWLVEFFAPWCGHCKNLAPHWEKAAKELKGKVKLGALDATVHQAKAAQFGVQGYPTIKFFAGGKKDKNSATDYDGGRTASDIVAWAQDKYVENVEAPEITELISEAIAKQACEEKPLCVISVLPHILDCDSKCRNKYLTLLRSMGDKYKTKQWGWLWFEAGAQSAIEEILDIGGFGYPAMAVVNIKKMKFSLLRGSFSNDGINEYLRDLSYGRGQTMSIKGAALPEIATIEPWDGKDGQMPEEEEIDLSDIDLDEKDEL